MSFRSVRRVGYPALVAPLFLVMLLILPGCDFMGFHSWRWQQKLTVTVDTPDGSKTAYSVTDAGWEMTPEWFRIGDSGGGHGSGELRGEAVVLEVAPGKYLFVLLKDYSAETAIKIFAEPPLRTDNRREFAPALDRISKAREARALPRDLYPLLVTFDDIDDPASVKKVDPGNLEAAFGPGYSLNAITITITGEPVTEGEMDSVLGWLGPYPEPRLSPATGRTTNIPFSRRVSHGDFIRR